MSSDVCTRVCMHIHTCICMNFSSIHACWYAYVSRHACMCVLTSLCMCIGVFYACNQCMHMYIKHIYVYICICMCLHVWAYQSVHTSVNVSMPMHAHLYMFVPMHVHVCALYTYACMSVRGLIQSLSCQWTSNHRQNNRLSCLQERQTLFFKEWFLTRNQHHQDEALSLDTGPGTHRAHAVC